MNEKKQFHLKIKWKNKEKTEAHEIVLYDGGQPLCELISVDDAKLVRDIMNEQGERIQELEQESKRYVWNPMMIDKLNEQEELIKRLKQTREEQTETILKLKRKIQELEECREELFIRERDTKNEWRDLKERNQRQYDQLKELTDLMTERDWESLEKIVEDWEQTEEQLKREWRNYENI